MLRIFGGRCDLIFLEHFKKCCLSFFKANIILPLSQQALHAQARPARSHVSIFRIEDRMLCTFLRKNNPLQLDHITRLRSVSDSLKISKDNFIN